MNTVKSALTFLTRTTSPDRNEARNEYMLRAILVSMAAITVAGSIIGTFGALFGSVKYDTVMILAAMSVLFMTGWYLAGKGRWRIARFIPVSLFLLAAIYGIYLGGIGTPSLLLLAVTIMLTAMFFGMKGLGLTVSILLSSYILLGELHHRGIIIAVRSDQSAYQNRVLIAVAALLAIVVLLRFLIRQMEKEIEVSLGHEEELAATNEELQAAIEELEATNEEFEAANEELLRTNRELDESESKYRGLVESIREVIFSTDETGVLTYVSPAIRLVLGIGPDKYIGRNFAEFIYTEDMERMVASFYRVAAGSTETEEYRILDPEGVPLWVSSTSSPKMENGLFRGINGVLSDINTRKHAELELRKKEQELRESERVMRSIFNASPAGIATVVERRIQQVNAMFCWITGYSEEELLGQSTRMIYTNDEEFEQVGRYLFGEIERSGRGMIEAHLRRRDGVERDVLMGMAPIDPGDPHAGACATLLDITERKKAEDALRLTQFAMDHASDSILWVDDGGNIIYANEAASKSMGYSRAELTRMQVFDIDPDFPAGGYEDHMRRLRESGTMTFESRHRARDGRIFPVEVTTNYIDCKGRFLGVAFDRDITERKRAEEALKLSELTYREIFNKIGETIWIHDIETLQFVDVNESATKMFGYSHDELMNLTLGDISSGIPPYDEENGVKFLKKAAAGEPQHFEWHCRHRDGHFFWTEVRLRHGIIAGKECLLAIEHDITKRKEAEETIRTMNLELERKVQERTEELRRAYDNLVKINGELETALKNLGDTQQQLVLSEKLAALGQLAAGMAHELNTPLGAIISSNRSMINIIHNGLPELADLVAGLRKNDKFWFDSLLAESLDNAVQIDRSIDRKTRLDIRLQLQEAGALDNRAFAETIADLGLHRYLKEHPEPLKSEHLGDILKGVSSLASLRRLGEIVAIAAEKASHVVGTLRSYLRQDEPGDLSLVDLVNEIDLVLTLYHNKLKYGVEVEKRYGEGLFVLGNRNGLNQVWMNLLNNALQAMDYKGSLEIVAEKKEEWIVVSVIDSGPGVPEDIRDRIFEPFFTTKKHGEGIGLGLDICRKIVDSLGGRIEMVSVPGRTEFRVWLRQAAMPS